MGLCTFWQLLTYEPICHSVNAQELEVISSSEMLNVTVGWASDGAGGSERAAGSNSAKKTPQKLNIIKGDIIMHQLHAGCGRREAE